MLQRGAANAESVDRWIPDRAGRASGMMTVV
jgi:hypothetical protein